MGGAVGILIKFIRFAYSLIYLTAMDTNTSSMRPFVVKDLVETVMDRKAMAFDDAVFMCILPIYI